MKKITKIEQLLELRKQYQDAVFFHEKTVWDGIKILVGVIFSLSSVQAGFMYNSKRKNIERYYIINLFSAMDNTNWHNIISYYWVF